MRITLACALIVLVARVASAQDFHGYVGGSLFGSTQDSHPPGNSPDVPTTGVGGRTWGATVEAGVLATPRFGVGIELTLPSRIEAVQETNYYDVFRTQNNYRDLTLAFIARAYSQPSDHVRVALVGGFAMVQESVIQNTSYAQCSNACSVLAPFSPFGPEQEFTRWTPGLVGGVDVEFAIARHLSVVPQVRAMWVNRTDDPTEPMWSLGLDPLVLRAAIGVRATF